MVYRIYVEKRPGLSPEAENLKNDLRTFLGIDALEGIRILNRYDVENIAPEVYAAAKNTVFSEHIRYVTNLIYQRKQSFRCLLAHHQKVK